MKCNRVFLLFLLIFTLFFLLTSSKRSGGRSGGKGKSGTGFWNRRSQARGQQQTAQGATYPKQEYAAAPAPASAPKPSAPKPVQETAVKQTNVGQQQSHVGQQQSQQQRPIGWNPPPASNNNNAPPAYSKSAYPQQAPPPYSATNTRNSYPHQQAAPPYSANDPNRNVYSQQSQYPGAYPNTGSNNYYGTGSNYNYGSAGYPQQGYNHPAPPAYHPPMNNAPGAYGGYGGYGGAPGAPNYGHNPYQQQQSGGMFGNFFGGNKNNGYGGGMMGGGMMGGYGGYGMKKSGGFFGGHAVRNILAGMLIWHVVSGLTRRPYRVYNYENPPEEKEISLPSNLLTLCNENVTNLCAPGTTAICTTNNTILCVTTMQAVSPCPHENSAMCVSSKIPCVDSSDPVCQNNTKEQNFTTVPLPCFANLTVDVNLMNFDPNKNGTNNGNVTITGNQDYTYCVTTYAVAGPEEPCPANGTSTDNTSCLNGAADLSPPPNLESTTLNSTAQVNQTQSVTP